MNFRDQNVDNLFNFIILWIGIFGTRARWEKLTKVFVLTTRQLRLWFWFWLLLALLRIRIFLAKFRIWIRFDGAVAKGVIGMLVAVFSLRIRIKRACGN
jgi:hypothetical protein